MPQAKLTIGELEAGYPLYCKALRRLLQQGKSPKDIERTVCWGTWRPSTAACQHAKSSYLLPSSGGPEKKEFDVSLVDSLAAKANHFSVFPSRRDSMTEAEGGVLGKILIEM